MERATRQDLLAQAISGLPWLSGSRDDPPSYGRNRPRFTSRRSTSRRGSRAMLAGARARTGVGGRGDEPAGVDADPQFELLSARFFADETPEGAGGPSSAHAFSLHCTASIGTCRRLSGHRDDAASPNSAACSASLSLRHSPTRSPSGRRATASGRDRRTTGRRRHGHLAPNPGRRGHLVCAGACSGAAHRARGFCRDRDDAAVGRQAEWS